MLIGHTVEEERCEKTRGRAQLLTNRSQCPIPQEDVEKSYLKKKWVETRLIEHQSINNILLIPLSSKCAKYLVPNDQKTAVVFVNAIEIAAVVNSVVLRRVQYELQRAQTLDSSRMNPKLVQEVELLVR